MLWSTSRLTPWSAFLCILYATFGPSYTLDKLNFRVFLDIFVETYVVFQSPVSMRRKKYAAVLISTVVYIGCVTSTVKLAIRM